MILDYLNYNAPLTTFTNELVTFQFILRLAPYTNKVIESFLMDFLWLQSSAIGSLLSFHMASSYTLYILYKNMEFLSIAN